METHAHHIHKAPGQGWKHYFSEFLMLFLAVLCGFLAENMREHAVEAKKEKQYLKSLWLDVRNDTASLRKSSVELKESNRRIDTLLQLLKSNYRNDFACKIYKMAVSIPFEGQVPHPDNKTFEELKSSGNLRLINNQELLNSIGVYYELYNKMQTGGPGQMSFQNRHDLYLFTYELFDMVVFQKMLESSVRMTPAGPILPDSCVEKPVLLSNDPIVINKICGRYFYIQMTRNVITWWINELFLKKADSLLTNLQNEYHFEN